MFRHRSDVARRPAIGDDERVGKRRTAFEIDGHDVFRFVVIEGFEDAVEQRALRLGGLRCGFLGRAFGGGGFAGQDCILSRRVNCAVILTWRNRAHQGLIAQGGLANCGGAFGIARPIDERDGGRFRIGKPVRRKYTRAVEPQQRFRVQRG